MQNAKTKFKRKLHHFKLILQWVFTHRADLLLASLSQSFEEGKYICQGRLTYWLAKFSELTEYEGLEIRGIKLPKRFLQQETLLLQILHAIVRLREVMISNMEFMHNTSVMLNSLKTIIIQKQKNPNN